MDKLGVRGILECCKAGKRLEGAPRSTSKFGTRPPIILRSGNPNGGLGKRGANWAKKGPFGGKFCSPPLAVRCGGKAPKRP